MDWYLSLHGDGSMFKNADGETFFFLLREIGKTFEQFKFMGGIRYPAGHVSVRI